MYMRVHKLAAEEYSAVKEEGPELVSRHLLQLMSLLEPLRRICSGGCLKDKDLRVPDAYGLGPSTSPDIKGVAATDQMHGGEEEDEVGPEEEPSCAICHEMYEQPARTPCHHCFCR